ncbi:uncharacterized protein [Rutidosis leptorrhynchoides]|uniref:uncharacterized protein n=1 Tax=Rutidosis leptorrhynchoides TaxID=125765 RepID=UPI003A996EC4
MLSSDELENGVFFDSVDCLSSDTIEDLNCEKLEKYELWTNEPVSVRERREMFLREMGLIQITGLNERTKDCSHVVSSSENSEVEEHLICGRVVNLEANCMIDEYFESDEESKQNTDVELCCSTENCKQKNNFGEESVKEKRAKKWWKRLVSMRRRESLRASDIRSMKVKQKNKRCMELTGLFTRQEIGAHKGSILTMKFSPDGQYLATGGTDGIVFIWHVTTTNVPHESFLSKGNFKGNADNNNMPSVVFPEKVFHIEESPVHRFEGHSSYVLDLSWSNSNILISCSKDKTVRLWQVGSDRCQHVFHHSNYVTCVQFNPVDNNNFISGSIDGKVRIWGVSGKRVVDWADVRDVITAVCYQPDGNGFVVGTITGTCSFYEASANLELESEVHIRSKRKSLGKRITGIQFSRENPQKVMISSEDSKLQILDGLDVVHKFKGLLKSRSQMSASFTSTGKHIISVGEDSCVYVWNYEDPSSKLKKSVKSCEHFFSERVSVAVPWSTENVDLRSSVKSKMQVRKDNYSERFSLGSWFFNDVVPTSKGSATWPEEKLPIWDLMANEGDICNLNHQRKVDGNSSMPDSWGLVIVTGGWDGTIRTFHNYGLPVSLNNEEQQCKMTSFERIIGALQSVETREVALSLLTKVENGKAHRRKQKVQNIG